jgi:hypothetical protein
VVRRPGNNFWAFNLFSDSRKPVVLSFYPNYNRTDEGIVSYQVGFDIRVKPASNVSFSVGPYYSRSRSSRQFVSSQTDPTATAFFGRRYIFADLDQRSLSMDTRLNITFTPTLTLELYAQPFISSQAYSRFKEFAAPRESGMVVYGEDVGTVTTAGDGFDRSYTDTGLDRRSSWSGPNRAAISDRNHPCFSGATSMRSSTRVRTTSFWSR